MLNVFKSYIRALRPHYTMRDTVHIFVCTLVLGAVLESLRVFWGWVGHIPWSLTPALNLFTMSFTWLAVLGNLDRNDPAEQIQRDTITGVLGWCQVYGFLWVFTFGQPELHEAMVFCSLITYIIAIRKFMILADYAASKLGKKKDK